MKNVVMQSGEIPGTETAREGELSGDEVEEQIVQSIRFIPGITQSKA